MSKRFAPPSGRKVHHRILVFEVRCMRIALKPKGITAGTLAMDLDISRQGIHNAEKGFNKRQLYRLHRELRYKVDTLLSQEELERLAFELASPWEESEKLRQLPFKKGVQDESDT